MPHARFHFAEILREAFGAAALMPHAYKLQRRIQHVEIIEAHLTGGKTFQIVAVGSACVRPTETNFVQLVGRYAGKIQTSLHRQARKCGIMFHAADALFRYGKKQFSVAHNAGRGVVHPRIVDAHRQQMI